MVCVDLRISDSLGHRVDVRPEFAGFLGVCFLRPGHLCTFSIVYYLSLNMSSCMSYIRPNSSTARSSFCK